MHSTIRSALLIASISVIPAAGAFAQPYNNPGDAGGIHGSKFANPTYPATTPNDPALTTGRPDRMSASLPPSENPTVPGATGMTVVPGDNSTINSDRRGTVSEKTDGIMSDGGNN
jgi:hypothetical protein